MFTTKTLSTIVATFAMAAFVGTASAANILWVDNETPDASWQTLIESGGHTYTLFDKSTYSLTLGNQASKDYVNGFDVIVMSGSNPAFNAVRNAGQTWHAQPTPIVSVAAYLASGQFTNNSHGWFTSAGTAANSTASTLDVNIDPTDLIWTDVTLINGNTQTPDLFAANRRYARQDAGDLLKPGVTSVATNAGQPSQQIIMYAEPGSIAPGGGAAYYFAGMSGGSGEAVPYTADGEQVFLNTLGVLSGELVPEPASVALLGLGGLLVAGRSKA